MSGTIRTEATTVKDLVYDAVLKPRGGSGTAREYSLSLLPNDIRIIALNEAQAATLRCNFAYAPDTAAQIIKQARDILQNATVADALPAAKRAALASAVEKSDIFATQRLLMDWEILAVTMKLP